MEEKQEEEGGGVSHQVVICGVVISFWRELVLTQREDVGCLVEHIRERHLSDGGSTELFLAHLLKCSADCCSRRLQSSQMYK